MFTPETPDGGASMDAMTTHRRFQRHAGTGSRNRGYPWPLLFIAAPAAVAIWSGWVGLGSMCGFGPVNLLPGIGSGFHLNTAITLPVGIESYGAYALYAWLALKGASGRTRTFARKSAVGALLLGCLGQVAYHLLAAAHWAEAPWLVTVAVACLPVVTLYFAAPLTPLILADRRAEAEAAEQAVKAAAEAERARAERAAARAETGPRKPTGTAGPNRKRKAAGTAARKQLPATPEPAAEETVDIDAEARILQLVAEGHSASKAGIMVGKSDSYGRAVVRQAKKLGEAAPEEQEAKASS